MGADLTPEAFRKSLPEKHIQAAIMEAAQLYGWRRIHLRPARTDRGWRTAYEGDDGFPDILAVRGERTVIVECKRHGARPTPAQQAWLDAFRAAGAEVYVWTPLDADKIEEVFR